jgi:hypothetical protein
LPGICTDSAGPAGFFLCKANVRQIAGTKRAPPERWCCVLPGRRIAPDFYCRRCLTLISGLPGSRAVSAFGRQRPRSVGGCRCVACGSKQGAPLHFDRSNVLT